MLWRNGSAHAMLEEAEPFLESSGLLTAVDRPQAGMLRDFIKGVDEPSAWIYRDGDQFWTLRAEALRPEGHPPAAAVMFFCHGREPRHVWADFGKAFGLTRSETEVVKQLVGGAGAEEIAHTLDISIETVRTHIKRTYGKLAVVNREQLFAMLIQFRVYLSRYFLG
ncbi:MAG: hypothetical protein GC145_02660 [Caulobacter sp.]|nr:hypothetical protein [Caulobacter sp.]